MKRKLLFIFMALVVMASTNMNAQIAEKVAGTYSGDLEVEAAGGKTEISGQEILMTATGDAEITLSIKDFTFPGVGNIGDIVVAGVNLEEANGAYTFTAEEELEILGGDFPLAIEGTVNNSGKLDLTIEIAGEIQVAFNGFHISNSAAGTYTGELEVTAVGTVTPISDQEIIITATGDKEVTLSIKDFTFPGVGSIGDLDVPGVELVVEDGLYTFTTEAEVDIMGGDFPLDIVGTIDPNEAKLTFSIEIGGEIFVDFEGNKEVTPNSIGTVKETNKLIVYPSAAYDELNIEGLQNNTQYAIYNIAGLMVKKGLTNATVSIGDLSKGIYLINIEGRSVKFVKK